VVRSAPKPPARLASGLPAFDFTSGFEDDFEILHFGIERLAVISWLILVFVSIPVCQERQPVDSIESIGKRAAPRPAAFIRARHGSGISDSTL
jgi:hypothetical protein